MEQAPALVQSSLVQRGAPWQHLQRTSLLLPLTPPTHDDIHKLGHEDAIILVDAARQSNDPTRPIKMIVKEVADELDRCSKSCDPRLRNIDRSSGLLSSEHEHTCPEKRIVHSPSHVNTAWSLRDEYTLVAVNMLFALSDEDLTKLLSDKAPHFRKQRKKGVRHCPQCYMLEERIRKGIATPAERSPAPGVEQHPGTVTKIMVGGLPRNADERDLCRLFADPRFPSAAGWGIILEARRLEKCAFIRFSNRRMAEDAMNRMQGYSLDADGKVRLRLSWGRQQDRHNLLNHQTT